MKPFSKILAATDFSAIADEALAAAGLFSERLGAELLLVHVHTTVEDATFGDLPPAMKSYGDALHARLALEAKTAAADLEARAARLPSGVRARTKVLSGRPADEIGAEAKAWGADLVVLGTHGKGAAMRAVLGSVAHDVLRSAPCPVLLVGPHASER
jgi:nucleotide-binding universal stress UspA family protein